MTSPCHNCQLTGPGSLMQKSSPELILYSAAFATFDTFVCNFY